MSPFSMALMSGLKRQSVGARMASMPGSSSLRDMAKLVKLYICGTRPTLEYEQEGRKEASTQPSGVQRRFLLLRYRGRERRPGVYPPQQSASWNHGNRLLDLGHVVGVVVVRSVNNILQKEKQCLECLGVALKYHQNKRMT